MKMRLKPLCESLLPLTFDCVVFLQTSSPFLTELNTHTRAEEAEGGLNERWAMADLSTISANEMS